MNLKFKRFSFHYHLWSWMECTCAKSNRVDVIGKAYTCLFKVSQMTMYIREKSKTWGQRNFLPGSCVEAQIWERIPKISALLKVQKSTAILKWKKSVTRQIWLGHLAKLSNQERRALVREITKNLMLTWTELRYRVKTNERKKQNWTILYQAAKPKKLLK